MPQNLREWVAWLSPAALMLVGGILLFVPPPPTSTIGIALVFVGVVLRIVDYFGGGREERGRTV